MATIAKLTDIKYITQMTEIPDTAPEMKKTLSNDEIPTYIFTSAIANYSSGQDYVFTFENGGVLLDGHGDRGAFYSIYGGAAIAKRHASGAGSVEKWSEEIDQEALHELVSANPGMYIQDGLPYMGDKVVHGGTTATYVAIDPFTQVITVANAGDSKAYIFVENDGAFYAEEITVNNGPTSQAECDRIVGLRKSGQVVGKLMWNVTDRGEMVDMYDDDGQKIDYFSDHVAVQETTKAYYAATDAFEKGRTDANIQKKCLDAYHAAVKVSKASPTFSTYNRLAVGTAKGEYGSYLVGPMDKFGHRDTVLSCLVTIGDHHAKKVGARSNWDVRRIPISAVPVLAGKRMIFAASDGVHDCYTEEELAKEVMTTESVQELLSKFVQKSKKMFQKKKLGGVVQADDISFFRAYF
jgi:serine/threonine protein phosphatase PrpC